MKFKSSGHLAQNPASLSKENERKLSVKCIKKTITRKYFFSSHNHLQEISQRARAIDFLNIIIESASDEEPVALLCM